MLHEGHEGTKTERGNGQRIPYLQKKNPEQKNQKNK